MLRWLLILMALIAAPATAQLGPRQNAIRPELVAESPAVPGGEVELGILMHTDPGWHGYWINPGDAGLPMTIEWQLPDGASLAPLRFPVPDRLLVAGIVNYVYERDHAILTRLKVPANAKGVLPIRARAQWLACTDKVCVPERGEFSLNVPIGSGGPGERARFDEWRRALPRPLASPAHFAVKGDGIDIAVPLPESVEVGEPYFFPAEDGPIDYAAPQVFRRNGDQLVIELKRRRGDPRQLVGCSRSRGRAWAGDQGGAGAGARGRRAYWESGRPDGALRDPWRTGRRPPAQCDAMRVPDPGAEGAAPGEIGRGGTRRAA